MVKKEEKKVEKEEKKPEVQAEEQPKQSIVNTEFVNQ